MPTLGPIDMTIDLLIIGQGLCGTFLSMEAERAGLTFRVADAFRASSASRVSAGVLNPVTGMRLVESWLAGILLPYAEEAYRAAAPDCIREMPILQFFDDAVERRRFEKRKQEGSSFLGAVHPGGDRPLPFHQTDGYGTIRPAFVTDAAGLLAAVRRDLVDRGLLVEEDVPDDELTVQRTGVRWRDISARFAVFCDGAGASNRRWFAALPFAPAKGEALVVSVPGLPPEAVYKRTGLTLAPRPDGNFWAGASHEWTFEHDLPTTAFRVHTERALKKWLTVPFRTLGHVASVRPCTRDRRPYVGLHPHHPLAILGGMGTKGSSLAPYFARQLVARIVHGKEIHPEADVARCFL